MTLCPREKGTPSLLCPSQHLFLVQAVPWTWSNASAKTIETLAVRSVVPICMALKWVYTYSNRVQSLFSFLMLHYHVNAWTWHETTASLSCFRTDA